jgi:AcrR family transcriptional regulator
MNLNAMSHPREAILDAADRLLARYGYQKMTMDDLAKEARIGRRTIYLYFKSKQEIALASIDRVVERLLEQLRNIANSNESPERKIQRMLVERIMFRFDSVQDYYRSFDELFAALRNDYMARRKQYFEAESQIFAEVLREGNRKGIFSVSDLFITAQTLILATNSLIPYSLSVRELGAREEVIQKVSALADLLLTGLFRRHAPVVMRDVQSTGALSAYPDMSLAYPHDVVLHRS